MSLGPQIVNYGNVQATFILQLSLTPSAVSATTSAEQTFTVPGLLLGDQVSAVSFLGAYTVLVDYVNCRVSANNTLAISFANNTGGSLTPPSGTWLVEINRPAFPGPQPGVIQ